MDSDYPLSMQEAIENHYLVSFEFKPLNDLEIWGFVLACNDKFTLVNYFSRDIYLLDGYSVFYNDDVSGYWIYTDAEDYLETKYVKLKDIAPELQPSIKLESLPELLVSVSEKFPLMQIHRDGIENDSFLVGKLMELKENTFKFLAIRTDAKWKEVPSRFRYADVTRVDFGTIYEKVLITVAEKN